MTLYFVWQVSYSLINPIQADYSLSLEHFCKMVNGYSSIYLSQEELVKGGPVLVKSNLYEHHLYLFKSIRDEIVTYNTILSIQQHNIEIQDSNSAKICQSILKEFNVLPIDILQVKHGFVNKKSWFFICKTPSHSYWIVSYETPLYKQLIKRFSKEKAECLLLLLISHGYDNDVLDYTLIKKLGISPYWFYPNIMCCTIT